MTIWDLMRSPNGLMERKKKERSKIQDRGKRNIYSEWMGTSKVHLEGTVREVGGKSQGTRGYPEGNVINGVKFYRGKEE